MRETIFWRALRKFAKELMTYINRYRFNGHHEFVIVSNNCWGAEIYKHFKRPYNTPFVGLYLYPDCYLKLLSNWDEYINQPLNFNVDRKSKYCEQPFDFPIGLLGKDVEIHFMHYESEQEAKEKWERRKARMLQVKDANAYYYKLCDKLGCDVSKMKQFHKLPLANQISFTAYELNLPNNIIVEKRHLESGECPSGIGLYHLTHYYTDLVLWIEKGRIGSTFVHQLYRHFVI
jgi:uncharacterized protein (DUF1919 family)